MFENNNFKINKICCIGAGYVGGPTMAMIASKCKDIKVEVVDLDKKKISLWNDNNLENLPVFEPGLSQIIKECRNKNLTFSNNIKSAIETSDMIFIAVNTPTKSSGIGAGEASDLRFVESCARDIALYASDNTIVVEKSTIPVKTADIINKILNASNNSKKISKFYVLSNPEFLAEGTAINDLLNPNRVLIGGENHYAIEALSDIYSVWIDKKKIIKTNVWSSELSKLTANAFLAQRLSSVNTISAICERTGANIKEVSKAIGMDKRIGEYFLNHGPGFGGSCFKKDILNLIYLSKFYGLFEVADYWKQVLKINDWQKERISKLIVNKLFGNLKGKKIAILGFAFKANTNDTRESSAIDICKNLIEEGANLSIYDPKVGFERIAVDLKLNVTGADQNKKVYCSESIEESLKNADAAVILTEWEEFFNIEWNLYSESMRKPAWIFDSREVVKTSEIDHLKINLWTCGYAKFS